MKEKLKLDSFILLGIFIILNLFLTIIFYNQGYSNIYDFLGFYSLFSGGIFWELLIGKVYYSMIELILFVILNLVLLYGIIKVLLNKISKKYTYIFIFVLTIFFELIGIFLLGLGIWK